MVKVTGKSYYDQFPGVNFSAGDVWKGVPSLGLLKNPVCRAIVITPACDLSQRKTETITFLPLIPVAEYMRGVGFSPEIFRCMRGQAKTAGLQVDDLDDFKGSNLPSYSRIYEISNLANDLLEVKRCSDKRIKAAKRALDCAMILKYILDSSNNNRPDLDCIRSALMGEFDNLVGKIIKNSYKEDIHFLPFDEKERDFSSVDFHSVALFRYPFTLPYDLLNLADDVTIKDWPAALRSLAKKWPIASLCSASRPLRMTTVKQIFFSDLLARFSALHIRMGSPDFTSDTIDSFSKQIGESV